MKNPIRIISLSFLILLFQSANGQNTYKLNIEKDLSIYLTGINPMTNGDCLVAGYDIFNSADTQIRLARLNKQGRVIWSKIFQVPDYYEYSMDISPTNDNGFVAAARLDSSTEYSLGIQIFKCDSSGNIEWQKKVVSDNHTGLGGQKIIQTKDQGYYVAHVSSKPDLVNVSKLDKNGKLLWNRAFNPTALDNGYNIIKLSENEDGGAMLAIEESGCEYYCTDLRLFSFTKEGKPGFKIYLGPDFSGESIVSYLHQDSTGTINILLNAYLYRYSRIAIGYAYAIIPTDPEKGKFIRIKDNIFSLQQFLRTNKILADNEVKYKGNTLYIDKDWSIITAADSVKDNRKHYIQMKKYDSLGRICPAFSIPIADTTLTYKKYSFNRFPFNLEKVTGITIVNSPMLSTPVNNTTLLCSGTASSDIDNKESTFTNKTVDKNYITSIFPNPVNTYLNLIINSDKNEFAKIQILNSSGTVVKEYSSMFIINNNTKFYDVSSLAKGFYMLTITTKTTHQTVKFIKE